MYINNYVVVRPLPYPASTLSYIFALNVVEVNPASRFMLQ